jgi:hypothetical protein
MHYRYLCLLVAVSLASLATVASAQVERKTEVGTPTTEVKVAEGGKLPQQYQSGDNVDDTGRDSSERTSSRPKKLKLIEVEETVHHCVVDNCW